MTSAEFAAKYRVLKSLTEHGARSQIAQELSLGRMVMVHHLDVGSAKDRQRLLANVAALEPSAAAKVIEVTDIDGTKVVVTQFLATFTDFPTWLQQNVSISADAATVVIQAVTPSTRVPSTPAAAPPARPLGAPDQAPGFTAVFGAGGVTPPPPPPAAGDFTRQFQSLNAPPPPPPPPPPTRPAAPPPRPPAAASPPPPPTRPA